MAFPAIDTGSLTQANSGGNVTTRVIAYPAGVATGDLILCFVSNDGAADTVTLSNFTQLGTARHSAAADNGAGTWFYRVASGAHSGNETITVTSTEWIVAAMLRIPASQWFGTIANGVEITSLANPAASNANPNPPSETASWGSEDNLWIAAASWDDVPTYVSSPSTYTHLVDIDPAAAGCAGLAIAWKNVAAATEDPGTFAISAAEQWSAHTVVVRPAAGGGGSPTMFTPDPVVVTLGVPAPSIAKALSLSPAPVATTPNVVAPTVDKALGLTPTPVVVSTAVPEPTIDRPSAPIMLTPDPVAVTLAVPAPTMPKALSLSPAPVAVVLTDPAPTMGMTLALAPAPVATTPAVPAPTLSSALNIAPAAVPVALGVPAPTVSKALTLSPDPVAAQTAVPVPTLVTPGAPIMLSPDPVVLQLAVTEPTLNLGAAPVVGDTPSLTGGGGGYAREAWQRGGRQLDGMELDDESALLLLLMSAP